MTHGRDWIILDELTDTHFEQIYAFYREQWWCQGREPEAVRGAFDGSAAVAIAVDPASGRAVGCVRAISDGYFSATICDVIADPGLRGTGIGVALMEAILAHPALARIARFDLTCLDEMDPFYARWGFAKPANGAHLLRRGPSLDPGAGR